MKKGFTLVELVIVIVILGILATVAIPKFVDLTSDAKNAAAKGSLGGLRSAISIFYAQSAVTSSGSPTWPQTTTDIEGAMAQGVPVNAASGNTSAILVTNAAVETDTTYGWVYNSTNGRIYAANDTDW